MRRWCLLVLVGCGRIGFDARTDAGRGDSAVPVNGNIAFVTSTTHVPGAFGGLTVPDEICAARASEAGFAGAFVAFLSIDTLDARDRISVARGWYRPDGVPIGDQAYDFTATSIIHPIRLDEQGRDLLNDMSSYVATGTFAGIANLHCQSFTTTADNGMGGFPSYVGGGWMNLNTISCATPMRLYCFQTDYNEPLVVTRSQGRRAFVSSPTFDPSSGVAAADSLCASDATLFGVPGTFLALLPTTAPGPDRFDVDGAPWVRLDGIALAPTAREFLEGRNTAALNMTAGGVFVDGYATTGVANNAFEPVDVSRTCGNWNLPGGTSQRGWCASTGIASYVQTTADCTTPSRVYCLEQ